jgi:hypothetical protein
MYFIVVPFWTTSICKHVNVASVGETSLVIIREDTN